MSDRAMSLERSPPRARFETVHPETPEQTSATRPAPAVTTNGASQQNPPQAGGGVGQGVGKLLAGSEAVVTARQDST